MNDPGFNVYMEAMLHKVAQALLIPVLIALALVLLYALYCVGSVIVELITERRRFAVDSPRVIQDIHDAEPDGLSEVIENSALLKPQKQALLTVTSKMSLDEDELFALARTEADKVSGRYKKILARSELITKAAPMLGLMCTLIPLGPGIVAMGRGDVATLSSSLLVAFDGTVAGLVAAVVAMLVTAFRKRWYARYQVVTESLMTAILSKAESVRNIK